MVLLRFVLMITLVFSGGVCAQTLPTVWHNIGQSARIDWAQGVIQVRGAGEFPTGTTQAQGKLQAIGAARADALRLLAFVSAQIPVDAGQDMASYQLDIAQFVRGAQISEPVIASYQGRDIAYVDALMPLLGTNLLADVVLSQKKPRSARPTRVTQPSNQHATGMIIDARGLSLEPSLTSVIIDETGRVVYSLQNVQDVAEGMQRYYNSVAAARQHTGSNPLIIRALSVEGTTIRIDSSDATRILQADNNDDFLTQAKVAIVLQ